MPSEPVFLYEPGDRLCLRAVVNRKDLVILVVVVRRYEDDAEGATHSYLCRPFHRFSWGGTDDDAKVATVAGLRLYGEPELCRAPEGNWLEQEEETKSA